MFRRSPLEMRALILAPVGRDARLLADTLAPEFDVDICTNGVILIEKLTEGAGMAIVAEEALSSDCAEALSKWLASQPPWADLPIVILMSGGKPTPATMRRAHELEALGNFTFMERPVRPETVHSAVRSALRARLRQYEVRSRQEALIRANADLEQFAYSASHDLREPIRSIAIYTELFAKNYGHLIDAKGQEFLHFIQSGAYRMEGLLADLMSYAHASGIPDEVPEPISARGPVEAAITNLSAAIGESGARITIGEMPMVRMRQSHLEQVFQNLIGNAIKYRKEGAAVHICVTARKNDSHYAFSVQDDGIGISPEYLEVVFGLFKRLHADHVHAGSGMGLAICQRIVERYRGRIWVESEIGRGSTFFFTVPA